MAWMGVLPVMRAAGFEALRLGRALLIAPRRRIIRQRTPGFGTAIHLGQGGYLDEETCLRQSVGATDLDEALRQMGIDRVRQTIRITLEPSGKITVKRAG